MKAERDSPTGELKRVPWPCSTGFLVRGIVLGLLAFLVFWRAPDAAVVGVFLGIGAANEWLKFWRLEKRWAEANVPIKERTGVAMKAVIPPLMVSRRARRLGGADWKGARSWLGGAPRLGELAWPKSKAKGRPLAFLAQIDLAEVGAMIGWSPLPSTGSLTFFAGDRPIVYVPEQPVAELSPAPADAPTLDEVGYSGTGLIAWPKDPMGPRLFPHWPVDLTVQQGEAACREFNFSAREAFQQLGDAPRPQWWHSAIHFADCLRIAATFGVPNKLSVMEKGAVASPERAAAVEAFRRAMPSFRQYVEEVAAWTQGRDPWALLPGADAGRLAAVFQLGQIAFGEFTRYSIPHSMEDLSTVTLIALATAEERAYATLPAPIRNLINEKFLLPTDYSHQMFGDAIDIQGYAAELAESHYLLLRLNHDDMMHWGFGDNGAYHFFISPDDLAKRNWDAAMMTFECH